MFHLEHVIPALQRLGHDVLDPWADQGEIAAVQAMPDGPQKREAWRTLNFEIGRKNQAAIDACDAIFAVLDGTDVDSGTAAEIGYGYAKGKPIIGYRSDFRLSADNEGGIVNLQVEYFIRASGGDIIKQLSDVPTAFAKLHAGPQGPVLPPTAPPTTSTSTIPQNAGKSPVMAVVAIILAIVVKAALDKTFNQAGDWHTIFGLTGAQLFVFFFLTFRFYLGVLRFSDTEPKRIDFLVRSFNFFFAFFVFVGFYVTALSVTSPQYFYQDIVVLHCIDAAWFFLLFLVSFVQYVAVNELEPGELPIGPVRTIMITYAILSAVTVAWGLLAYPLLFDASLTDPSATLADGVYLGVLVLLSILDFALLKDYYFYFDDWKRRHGAIPTSFRA